MLQHLPTECLEKIFEIADEQETLTAVALAAVSPRWRGIIEGCRKRTGVPTEFYLDEKYAFVSSAMYSYAKSLGLRNIPLKRRLVLMAGVSPKEWFKEVYESAPGGALLKDMQEASLTENNLGTWEILKENYEPGETSLMIPIIKNTEPVQTYEVESEDEMSKEDFEAFASAFDRTGEPIEEIDDSIHRAFDEVKKSVGGMFEPNGPEYQRVTSEYMMKHLKETLPDLEDFEDFEDPVDPEGLEETLDYATYAKNIAEGSLHFDSVVDYASRKDNPVFFRQVVDCSNILWLNHRTMNRILTNRARKIYDMLEIPFDAIGLYHDARSMLLVDRKFADVFIEYVSKKTEEDPHFELHRDEIAHMYASGSVDLVEFAKETHPLDLEILQSMYTWQKIDKYCVSVLKACGVHPILESDPGVIIESLEAGFRSHAWNIHWISPHLEGFLRWVNDEYKILHGVPLDIPVPTPREDVYFN